MRGRIHLSGLVSSLRELVPEMEPLVRGEGVVLHLGPDHYALVRPAQRGVTAVTYWHERPEYHEALEGEVV